MTLRKKDFEEFIININQEQIRKCDLRQLISDKWGMSDYVVNKRLDILVNLKLIKESPQKSTVWLINYGE